MIVESGPPLTCLGEEAAPTTQDGKAREMKNPQSPTAVSPSAGSCPTFHVHLPASSPDAPPKRQPHPLVRSNEL